jgi:nucleoside-diphosphate-sugar epimerase
VLTSSFAAVIDISRTASAENKDFIYTSNDWNPLSFEEAIDPAASPVVAYRGSKKFAEIEAWDFVRNNQTPFALVTICPPMVFGPVANPISSPSQLNESNAQLWKVATNPKTLPETRVPLWIDVRDLAKIHVHALLSPQAGGKRLTAASPERFSYGLAAQILQKRLPHLARHSTEGESEPEESYQLDGLEAAKMFGIQYTKFETTVVDFLRQVDSWT